MQITSPQNPQLDFAFRALEFSLLETLQLPWDEALDLCKLTVSSDELARVLNPLEAVWVERLRLERDRLPQETAHWRLLGECVLLEFDPHVAREVPLQDRRHARELFGALALSQLGFTVGQITPLIQIPSVVIAWNEILKEASSSEAIGQAIDTLQVQLNLHRPFDFSRPQGDRIGDQLFQKFLFYRRLQDELEAHGFSAGVKLVLEEVENEELLQNFRTLLIKTLHGGLAEIEMGQGNGRNDDASLMARSERELWRRAYASPSPDKIVDVLAQIARLQFRRHETRQATKFRAAFRPELKIIHS